MRELIKKRIERFAKRFSTSAGLYRTKVYIGELGISIYQSAKCDSVPHKWGQKIYVIGLVAITIFLLIQALPQEGATIEMNVHSDRVGVAQWYFDLGHGYSDAESASARLRSGQNQIVFSLPPGTYHNLRFDPINNDGRVIIQTLRLKSEHAIGSDQIVLTGLLPLANIAELTVNSATLVITPTSGANDPQLQLTLARSLEIRLPHHRLASQIFCSFVFAGIILFSLNCILHRLTLRQFIAIGMVIAFVLIVAIGVLIPAGLNIHPDETLHLTCFSYFLDNFWPPAVTADAMVPSLTSSPWGLSYLNEYDVVYFIAAHSTSSLITLFGTVGGAAHAFQCILWFVLLLCATYRTAWAFVLFPLLISPQIWYVFSYFNGDAFPLFVSIIAAMLASDPNGGVKRFLDGGRWSEPAVLVFSLCIGLLIVSKSNFLPLIPGLFLWLSIRHIGMTWIELFCLFGALALFGGVVFLGKIPAVVGMHSEQAAMGGAILMLVVAVAKLTLRYFEDTSIRMAFLRLSLILILALIISSPRIIDDIWLNGLPAVKSAKVIASAEKYAAYDFKPSVFAKGQGYATSALAQKGVTLERMLFGQYHWIEISAASTLGVYGAMNIISPHRFYLLIGLCGLGIIGFVAIALVRAYPGQGKKLIFVATATCGLVLLSSILYSWVVGLQPQGRYLLPMFTMVGLIFGVGVPHIPQRLMKLMLLVALALSAYSYTFVALPGLVTQANP